MRPTFFLDFEIINVKPHFDILDIFHTVTYIIRPQKKKHPKNEEQLVQASLAATCPKFTTIPIMNKINANVFILLKKISNKKYCMIILKRSKLFRSFIFGKNE